MSVCISDHVSWTNLRQCILVSRSKHEPTVLLVAVSAVICEGIRDVSALRRLPKHPVLTHDSFPGITDRCIISTAQRCPGLTDLDISGNAAVTDTSLVALLKYATQLQVCLVRSSCFGVCVCACLWTCLRVCACLPMRMHVCV